MLGKLLLASCLVGGTGCSTAIISLLPESIAEEDAGLSDGSLSPIPLSEWKLDSDALDSGPRHNDGTLIGGAAFAQDAVRGGVLVCNGTDASVRIANTAGTSFTYATWIWSNTPSSTGTSAINGDGLLWANVAPAEDDFIFAVLNDRVAYVNYNMPSAGTTFVTDGRWHHVAVSRQDGASIAIYVDGKLDGQGQAGSGDVAGNPNIFFCGSNLNGGHYFKGEMDDVRQYDRVLSPSEVETIFLATR